MTLAICKICGVSPAWTVDNGDAYCDEHFASYQATVKKNKGTKAKTIVQKQSTPQLLDPTVISALPEPYYKDEKNGIELYLGDCKNILWSLPNNFAQAVITDPPYVLEGKTMNWDGGRNYVTDISDNKFADGFDIGLLDIMNAKLKNPNMMFFCNKAQILDYLEWAAEHKDSFQILEWHKPDCIPIGGFYLLDTEYIIHIFKDLKVKRKPINTYFMHNINHNKWSEMHSTSKPERIMIELIKQLTEPGDTVIEPYGGSGTTPACCKMLGRKCICMEISEKYAQVIVQRLKETEANQIQSGLFEF